MADLMDKHALSLAVLKTVDFTEMIARLPNGTLRKPPSIVLFLQFIFTRLLLTQRKNNEEHIASLFQRLARPGADDAWCSWLRGFSIFLVHTVLKRAKIRGSEIETLIMDYGNDALMRLQESVTCAKRMLSEAALSQ
jgi:hypothetical protein